MDAARIATPSPREARICCSHRGSVLLGGITLVAPAATVLGVDDFELVYDDHPGGSGTVVLLHGWPGDRHDWRESSPCSPAAAGSWCPTCGGSGSPSRRPARKRWRSGVTGRRAACSASSSSSGSALWSWPATTSARGPPGPRVRPARSRLRGMVLSPPVPGAGGGCWSRSAQREFWYQSFHQPPVGRAAAGRLPRRGAGVPGALLDALVRARLTCPRPRSWIVSPTPTAGQERSRRRSTGTARELGAVATGAQEKTPAPADRIAASTTLLWPEHDPLFPRAWSDRVDDWFADAQR